MVGRLVLPREHALRQSEILFWRSAEGGYDFSQPIAAKAVVTMIAAATASRPNMEAEPSAAVGVGEPKTRSAPLPLSLPRGIWLFCMMNYCSM